MNSPLFKFALAAITYMLYWLFIFPDLVTRKSSVFPLLAIVFAVIGAAVCVKLFTEIAKEQQVKK